MPRFKLVSLLLGAALFLAGWAWAAAPPPSLDRYGDPLPSGAVARLGTVRLRHPSGASGAAFFPDGKRLASWGNSTIRYWSLATGRELARLPGASRVAAASLSRPLFACAEEKGDVLLRDEAGKVVRRLKSACDDPRTAVLLSADGGTAASIHEVYVRSKFSSYCAVCLWRTATGRLLHRLDLKDHHLKPVAVLSPDGSTFALGGTNDLIDIIDVRTGERRHRLEAGKSVNHLAVSPDGKTLASGGDIGGEVQLWDIPSGKVLSKFNLGKWMAGPLAFLPCGKRLAVGGDDLVGICDLAARKVVRRVPGSAGWFGAIAVSPDGARLASVEHVVRVWDVKSGEEVLPFGEARWAHECLAFSPDGKTLAAGGGDNRRNTIDLWDVASSKRIRELAGHAWTVHSLTYLPTGGTLVSISADRTIVWWDTRTGKILRAREAEDQITALALSPDGATLVTNGDRRSALVVHKGQEGEPLPNLPVPGSNPHSLAFGLGGGVLATADYHFKGVNLWNFAARRLSVRIDDDTMDSDPALAVSPDGKTLAVSAWPSGAILYELATGRERLRIERRGSVCYSLAFAPNGQALAMSDRGGIEFRGVLRGKEMGRLRTPAYQSRLTFSPDGGRLASSGSDTAILIWDTSRLGGERVEPRKFGEKELAVLESDLRGPDARKAYQALAALAASPGQAVALLKHRLRPVERVPDSRVDAMIAALGSDDLETREAAAVGLGAMGAAAGARLRKALESKLDLEIVLRIKGLLAEVGRHPAPPRRLWEIRAIELLERIATPEARNLLRAIASGDPRAERSLDARAALGRLAKAAPG